MKVAHKTDTGRVRQNNEDSIKVDQANGIFLLADGMGGHQAGEVASDLAVSQAYAHLVTAVADAPGNGDISRSLAESTLLAHDTVREKSDTTPELKGMGTTLVQLVIKNGKAHICHVGDSRAYHLRRAKLRQITKDHTLGQRLVDNKLLLPEQVPPSKWHTLTLAVGLSEVLVPELNEVELEAQDWLLLCSDGLTDMLTDQEIEHLVTRHHADLEQAVEALVESANNKGGRDNISVVLVRYE